MEGSIIFYTYGSTLELNGQQFEAGRLRRPILPAKDDRALRRSFTTSTLRNQESGRS